MPPSNRSMIFPCGLSAPAVVAVNVSAGRVDDVDVQGLQQGIDAFLRAQPAGEQDADLPRFVTGPGLRGEHGSANGYTTLIVETSTSRYADHSAAAYRLVAIRTRSLVPATAKALSRSRMGGGLCKIRKAGSWSAPGAVR